MAGVRGDISFALSLTQVGANDLGSPKMGINVSRVLSLFEGTDAVNKANVLFSDTRTLAASTGEDIDLSGALTDAFGASILAAEVVALYISADSGNTNDVQVTRPASNGFAGPFLAAGDGVAVKPGEWAAFISEAGWAVTAATGDLLHIANSGAGTSVTYSIVVIGRTVAA